MLNSLKLAVEEICSRRRSLFAWQSSARSSRDVDSSNSIGAKMKLTGHIGFWAILTIGLLVGCNSAETGQRFLHFQIKVDDKLAFETKAGVPDETAVENMWDSIEQATFETSKDYAEILNTENSDTHKLTGDVVIQISHVGKTLTTSTVEALQMKKNTEGEWTIVQSELVLIKQSAVKN